MSTVAKRGEDFGMPSKERATGPESQVLDDRPEIVPSSSLALLEPAKVANGSKGQVSKARASSVAKPADTIHGDSDSDDDMPTKAQHPAGTVSEPAQASKKPRKKAATFDDQARTRFLRYRIEKRKEHARWLETTALKDVFDRLAPDFCGTRYPEYSYTGGELQNLERSLRRTFTAYRDKGYDSDRTLRLQGKAPPKDDLWELMKQFFGTEDGKETTSKTGTVPLRARRRPSEDSEPDFAPRAVSPYILEVRSRKTRAASFDSVDLEIRQQPTEAELAVQTEEEVVDESDEETRWAIRRGEIVDESDDESRYRIRNDYQKKRQWNSVIGAARFGAENAGPINAPSRNSVSPERKQSLTAPARLPREKKKDNTTSRKNPDSDTATDNAKTRRKPVKTYKGKEKAPQVPVEPTMRLSKSLVGTDDDSCSDLEEIIEVAPVVDKKKLQSPERSPSPAASVDSEPKRPTVAATSSEDPKKDESAAKVAVLAPQPAKRKRGRPRKNPETTVDGEPKPKKARARKEQVVAAVGEGESVVGDGSVEDTGKQPVKRKRTKNDAPKAPDGEGDEPKPPKRARAPRKKKTKKDDGDVVIISDTEHGPSTHHQQPPAPVFQGPFLTEFPTRSVHFLRVTDHHLMQVVLYLRKKTLDGWWSQARFDELMLCLRCELAAKLEKEAQAKTKGLADIQRFPNFAMSYYLTPNEIDHSFLMLPDTNADRYTPLWVYPLAIVVFAEPPRAVGLPEFWGVKFGKQPKPAKPEKKRKKKEGAEGAGAGAKKKQVTLAEVLGSGKEKTVVEKPAVVDDVIEIGSDSELPAELAPVKPALPKPAAEEPVVVLDSDKEMDDAGDVVVEGKQNGGQEAWEAEADEDEAPPRKSCVIT